MAKTTSRGNIIATILILLGALVRVYKIFDLVPFSGEIGWYHMAARDVFLDNSLPLVSIPSSVPVLRQGGIYTWILALVLKLGNYHPYASVIFSLIVGVASLSATYVVTKSVGKEKLALFTLFLACLSPLAVLHSRMAFIINPMYLITLVVFWLFVKVSKAKGKYIFILGLMLAIAFQFELAAFILYPIFTVALFVKRKGFLKWSFLKFVSGVLFGLLPFILYDFQQGVFIQTVGFLAWLAGKPIDFANGLANPVVGSFIDLAQASQLISYLYLPTAKYVALGVLGLAIGVGLNKSSRRGNAHFNFTVLVFWVIVGYLSFVLRGTYSNAYTPIVMYPTFVVIANLLLYFYQRNRYLVLAALTLIVIINGKFLIETDFFLKLRGQSTLANKIAVAEYVVADANGKAYSLGYVGEGDNFHTAANNYQYLLWWLGNEPAARADIRYTIYEKGYDNDSESGVKIVDVRITKTKLP